MFSLIKGCPIDGRWCYPAGSSTLSIDEQEYLHEVLYPEAENFLEGVIPAVGLHRCSPRSRRGRLLSQASQVRNAAMKRICEIDLINTV